MVTVIFTDKSGRFFVRKADRFLSIDTVASEIIVSEITMSEIKPIRVHTGDETLIAAKTNKKPDCTLPLETSEMNTTNQSPNSFKGESNDHFTKFKKNFRIGTENTASNGDKEIRLITINPAGNVNEMVYMESEPHYRGSNREERRQKQQKQILKEQRGEQA
jgi:hypothetical protein